VERPRVQAKSPFAQSWGYSRAIRVGSHIHVSGTAPIMPGDADPPADPYRQAKRCLEIVVAALAELGAGPEHVVRTRTFVTRADAAEGVGRAHGEIFGDIRPASTGVVVAALLDPRWLVEIEADAVVSSDPG
jgi:enamine deaminase RidA (YjgF/YER057c/UK114 family)